MMDMWSSAISERAFAPRWLYAAVNLTRLPGRRSADQEWRAFLSRVRLGAKSMVGAVPATRSRCRKGPAGPALPFASAHEDSLFAMSHPFCKILIARWTTPSRQKGRDV